MRPQQMTEFDLSECKLTVADLVPFLHVQRLDLSHNLLTWPKLKKYVPVANRSVSDFSRLRFE